MRCPHCSVGVNFDWEEASTYADPDFDTTGQGRQLVHASCPECDMMVAFLNIGQCKENSSDSFRYYEMTEVQREELVYPRSASRPLPTEVPAEYRGDFLEACQVILASPKASAALSRRVLQRVLREHYEIPPSRLDKEIEAFLARDGVPTYLTGAIDAVRNIGNFAAHPSKNTNSGEVVDVEPGEAEWLLDVLEALYDFTFVQPRRLEARKEALNEKLRALKRPPMKAK